MLQAILSEDLETVSLLLSKGANPNKTVSNGKTCLGEAAYRGSTEIAKKLIAESHCDNTTKPLGNYEGDCACTSPNKNVTLKSLKRKLDKLTLDVNEKCKTLSDRRSKLELDPLKEGRNQGYYKMIHKDGSSSEESKVGGITVPATPTSPQTELEWDEDIGNVAASTSEDESVTSMYKLSTGAAISAASDYTCGIDQPDAFGRTALNYAAEQNNVEIVKALAEAGCKLDYAGSSGWSPLHASVASDRIDVVKALLSAGSDVNLRTPITLVADHGAILDLRDEKDRTALYIAAAQGHTDIVRFLIARGANYEMVELLASHGCGINVHNSIGETPLLLAMTIDNPCPFASVLLEKGANVNACNSHTGASALHVAVEFSEDPREFESLLNLLMNHSIDLDKRASTQDTALNRAILLHKCLSERVKQPHGRERAARRRGVQRGPARVREPAEPAHEPLHRPGQESLDSGHRPEQSNTTAQVMNACNSHTGASALHVAVELSEDPREFETLLNLLMNHSIDLDKRASTQDTALNRAILLHNHTGARALHVAVELSEDPREFESLLNLLMKHSIDLDKRASTQDTALNSSILLHKDRIAMQLVRYGANVNLCEVLTNVFGNLIIASNRKSTKLANMLIKAGHNKVILNLINNPKKTAKWITEIFKSPLSLADICRIQIRNMRENEINLRDFVASLPIPDIIKNFLMMEELVP
ncbi:putative ankyrin repeat-containing protein [Operophtera brumata]|uniref:Putative ankyrin repeat-containing protein n=1 Tax=Operophtera brumata TaxID=104452 RepID=A0A0L7L3V3_OPEBR|nr:putative ankyrin repeat-containing protein [Operophtera brumata]